MSRESNEYEVGFAKPPKANQFRKGQSGNSRGRPKGARGLKTDLREVMGERLPVTQNGKTVKMSAQMIMLKSMCRKAMKGDPRATSKLIDLVSTLFGDNDGSPSESTLSDADDNFLEIYLSNRLKQERENET